MKIYDFGDKINLEKFSSQEIISLLSITGCTKPNAWHVYSSLNGAKMLISESVEYIWLFGDEIFSKTHDDDNNTVGFRW